MHTVTGSTRLYGIVADPIRQVKTPAALNAVLRERGVDGILVPFHVGADGLAALMAALRSVRNFGGLIATVPHKQAIAALCDRLSPQAEAVGAANAVRRTADGALEGDILDGAGFVEGLRRAGMDPAGAAAFLAGAGGAAAAIAFALAEAGAARLTVSNRTERSAAALRDRLRAAYPDLPVALGQGDPAGHDLVVNATSLGMRPDDALPLDAGRLAPEMTVAEIVMEPAETALLLAARARGCRVQPGRPMLDGQIALMADFLGMRP